MAHWTSQHFLNFCRTYDSSDPSWKSSPIQRSGHNLYNASNESTKCKSCSVDETRCRVATDLSGHPSTIDFPKIESHPRLLAVNRVLPHSTTAWIWLTEWNKCTTCMRARSNLAPKSACSSPSSGQSQNTLRQSINRNFLSCPRRSVSENCHRTPLRERVRRTKSWMRNCEQVIWRHIYSRGETQWAIFRGVKCLKWH